MIRYRTKFGMLEFNIGDRVEYVYNERSDEKGKWLVDFSGTIIHIDEDSKTLHIKRDDNVRGGGVDHSWLLDARRFIRKIEPIVIPDNFFKKAE